MAILKINNISKYFGGLAAISNLSFELNKGEILALIGPNGAGKTTVFNLINGFYQPSAGQILLKETNITNKKPYQICSLGIARTFQVVKPLQRMSVLDNVLASAFLRHKNKKEAEDFSLEILQFVGLINDKDIISKSLPLGKRKKLEIARALATKPEILLLDESFAGLNPSELNESIEIIKKIKEKGITILIIEHHMKVIMSISDRIVVINYGEKIAEGTPLEIRETPAVVAAYLGQ